MEFRYETMEAPMIVHPVCGILGDVAGTTVTLSHWTWRKHHLSCWNGFKPDRRDHGGTWICASLAVRISTSLPWRNRWANILCRLSANANTRKVTARALANGGLRAQTPTKDATPVQDLSEHFKYSLPCFIFLLWMLCFPLSCFEHVNPIVISYLNVLRRDK